MKPYLPNCPACGVATPTRGFETIHALSHTTPLDQQAAELQDFFEALAKEQDKYLQRKAFEMGVRDDELDDFVMAQGGGDDLPA